MIITTAMLKGGTGKSTTAAALAQGAAAKRKKTLVIDLDPQANTSFFLAADATRPGSYELLTGTEGPRQLIQTTQGGLDVIPASWNLAAVTSSRGSARRLQKALEPIRGDYDMIILDCPPGAGEILFNALQTTDKLIIPLAADTTSLQGLYLTADTARQFRESNPGMEISGIILTRHNSRSIVTRQMERAIKEKAAELGIPYLGAVREAVAIKEAQTLQRNLYEYAPKSKPALDYLEVLQRIIGG